MGRPRKDGTPARPAGTKALDALSLAELKQVRNIVSQMDAELKAPADEYDYMGRGDSRKIGYMEVKVEALMTLLRMI